MNLPPAIAHMLVWARVNANPVGERLAASEEQRGGVSLDTANLDTSVSPSISHSFASERFCSFQTRRSENRLTGTAKARSQKKLKERHGNISRYFSSNSVKKRCNTVSWGQMRSEIICRILIQLKTWIILQQIRGLLREEWIVERHQCFLFIWFNFLDSHQNIFSMCVLFKWNAILMYKEMF